MREGWRYRDLVDAERSTLVPSWCTSLRPLRYCPRLLAHDPIVHILPDTWNGISSCLARAAPLVYEKGCRVRAKPRPSVDSSSNPFKSGRRPFTLSWYQVSNIDLYLTSQSSRPHETNLQYGVLGEVSGILKSSSRRLTGILGEQEIYP
jgi:hypothetical protein